MAAIAQGESGYVEQYGILKRYYKGRLVEVHFSVDGFMFCVGELFVVSENGLSDYPKEGEKTIAYRLINGTEDEARSAVQEFKKWFKQHHPSNDWLIPAGIGLVVVALGVTGLVIWKKKKRKAAASKADETASDETVTDETVPDNTAEAAAVTAETSAEETAKELSTAETAAEKPIAENPEQHSADSPD